MDNLYRIIHKSLRNFRTRLTQPNPLRFFLMGLNQGSCVRAPYATWFTTAATKDRGGGHCYQLPDVATCVAGTSLQDWHLPRHQGWTYQAPVRHDHPGYCTAEVGNPGGTYELPCIRQPCRVTCNKVNCSQFFRGVILLNFEQSEWLHRSRKWDWVWMSEMTA